MGSLSIVGVKPFYVKKAEGIFRREAHLKMRYPIILGWVSSLIDYSTDRSEMKRSNVFTWPILSRVIFWNLFPFFTTRRTFVRLRIKNKKIFSKSNTASIDQGPLTAIFQNKSSSATQSPRFSFHKVVYSVSSGPFYVQTILQYCKVLYILINRWELDFVGCAVAQPFLFGYGC